MWLSSVNTSTAPPTPTKPAAMPKPICSRCSRACAWTATSFFAFTVAPARMAASVVFDSTVTSTAGLTPTSPTPSVPATARWVKSLPAATCTD